MPCLKGVRIIPDIRPIAVKNTYTVIYKYKLSGQEKGYKLPLVETLVPLPEGAVQAEYIYYNPENQQSTKLGTIVFNSQHLIEYCIPSHPLLLVPLLMNEFRVNVPRDELPPIHSWNSLLTDPQQFFTASSPNNARQYFTELHKQWNIHFTLTHPHRGIRIEWHENLGWFQKGLRLFMRSSPCHDYRYTPQCTHHAGIILTDDSSRIRDMEFHLKNPLPCFHAPEVPSGISNCTLTITCLKRTEVPPEIPLKNAALFEKVLSFFYPSPPGNNNKVNLFQVKGKNYLDLILSEHLYGQHPEWTRETFRATKKSLLRKSIIAQTALASKLRELIPLFEEHSPENRIRNEKSIANLFLSILGALVSEAGMETAKQFVLACYRDKLSETTSSMTASSSSVTVQTSETSETSEAPLETTPTTVATVVATEIPGASETSEAPETTVATAATSVPSGISYALIDPEWILVASNSSPLPDSIEIEGISFTIDHQENYPDTPLYLCHLDRIVLHASPIPRPRDPAMDLNQLQDPHAREIYSLLNIHINTWIDNKIIGWTLQ
jgi:hypothetical protein